MSVYSLYDKTFSINGVYIFFLVNRIQVLYFVTLIPYYPSQPYIIWVIIVMGLLSQVNIMILAKWINSKYAAKGYQGFAQLFGDKLVRFLVFIGLFLFFIKASIVLLGYVERIHQFIFPSMNHSWLVLFISLTSCYLAAQGMENLLRFIVIAFLSTVWMVTLFVPFNIPPIARLQDLYPLIPTEWTIQSWKGLLLVWSSFSGPEYLICITSWLKPQQKNLRYMTYANAFTLFEYVFLFTAALFFYGTNFLSITKFPLVNMLRYLESPVFERMDIILLSLHSFIFIFFISFFILCFYGGIRIILGRRREQTTPIGFIISCMTIIIGMILVNEWLWKTKSIQPFWLYLQVWLVAITYTFVPFLLLVATKLKGRVSRL